MKSILAKQDDGTLQLSITIPQETAAKTREEVTREYVKTAQLPGFRKGKAPKKLVEEKIDQEKVQEEILKRLLPKAYIDAIEEHSLAPILNPKIQVQKLAPDSDWQFSALTCEAPEITLGDYKKNIQKITAKRKIIIPGKEQQPVSFDEIVGVLLESITIIIPGILKETEVDRMLSQTLDEVKTLGLTLDQYLSSTGKTAQALRDEYGKKAENDIKLEFGLSKIADEEKITVEEKEIDEAINKAKDEKERKNLQTNRHLLTNILRQQKTLDFLRNL